MRHPVTRPKSGQTGFALIISVMILMLVGLMAVHAISDSGEESIAVGRSRATVRSLFAADAGVQLALNRIGDKPPLLVPFDLTLTDGTRVQSRKRTDAVPQPITRSGYGAPPEGYEINVGSGYINEIFLVNVVSAAPAGSISELEAKLAHLDTDSGGY